MLKNMRMGAPAPAPIGFEALLPMRLTTQRIVLFSLAAIVLFPSAGTALTLAEGLAIVVDKGRDAAMARAEVDMARESVSLARAPWLPAVDLYGRETWMRYLPEVKTPGGSVPMSQDQYLSYGFRATQLLYDFGRTGAGISAAEYGLQAREAGARRTRNRAALEFLFAYYDLLEAIEVHKVAREEVTRYEAHRKDAEARFRAGVVTRNEVLQTDVLLADSKQRLLSAENNRSLRASQVNSLLLRPLNEPVHPQETAGTAPLPASLEDALAVAEKENADLSDVDARVRAREEVVRAVRAEYLPTVYVAGGYDYTENRYQVHEENWTLIAGVNVNLSAGGATNARAGIARGEAVSLRILRSKVLDAVRLEVKAAWLERESSQQRIAVAAAAVSQAGENLRLQRLRYREGVGTSTEVLDAVTLVTTAETNAWKAGFGLKRAEASLLHAMGRDLAAAYRGQ